MNLVSKWPVDDQNHDGLKKCSRSWYSLPNFCIFFANCVMVSEVHRSLSAFFLWILHTIMIIREYWNIKTQNNNINNNIKWKNGEETGQWLKGRSSSYTLVVGWERPFCVSTKTPKQKELMAGECNWPPIGWERHVIRGDWLMPSLHWSEPPILYGICPRKVSEL